MYLNTMIGTAFPCGVICVPCVNQSNRLSYARFADDSTSLHIVSG